MEDTLSLDTFQESWADIRGWSIETQKQEVVSHEEGPLWIIAGPGTGKTETLVMKTLKLLLVDGVRPGSIFLTTFTEKGAEELEDRLAGIIDDFGYGDEVDVSNVRIGTLHSLCDEVMRDYRYPDYVDIDLLDQDDQQFFVKKEAEMVNWLKNEEDAYEFFRDIYNRFSREYGPNTWQATRMATQILNRSRQYLVDKSELRGADDSILNQIPDYLDQYQEALRENFRTDFAELQLHFLDFLDSEFSNAFIEGDDDVDRPPLEYVLVDEYQDTNPLQEAIYFKLGDACDRNLIVVGDDDQSLYRFRGGSVECMVRFGEKCNGLWGIDPQTVQLKDNYRSHPEIVEWINRFIGQHRDLGTNARAPGKEPLNASSGVEGDYPAVSAVFQDSRSDAAELMSEFVEYLIDEEIVGDYSQIALLLRSTRESPQNAEAFVDALRDQDIPVHNPRNKALTEQQEIQLALGALVRVLDRELLGIETNEVRGRFLSTVEEWVDRFDEFIQTDMGEELAEYLAKSHESLDGRSPGENLESMQDVFYRILSREPFSTWREENPNRANRLSRLSNLIDAFSNVYSDDLRMSRSHDGEISHGWLKSFYYNFLQYVANSQFDEPEDPYEQIPKGYLQVMTVHQAKGLEFPVVLAGDLNKGGRPGGTHFLEEQLSPYSELDVSGSSKDARATNDAIRRFYVQYSRAEDALVLVGNENSVEQVALGYDGNGDPITSGRF
jgi:superfamily I DNA/RNA helicase